MTAVVGILNKQAVAVAADSAVSIYSNSVNRIFNKANKLFSLSKHHPIGVMLYNSAGFMSTPWETIIKIYRKQLGNTSFPTLKEYHENFVLFLRSKNFFTTADDQKQHLKQFGHTVIDTIVKEVVEKSMDLTSNLTDDNRNELLVRIEVAVDGYLNQIENSQDHCTDFIDYSYADFTTFSSQIFIELIAQDFIAFGYQPSLVLQEKLKRIVYAYLKTKEELTSFTGLIFTGFGEDEIYPSLIALNVSIAIENRLRFYIQENRTETISNNNSGAICPFAQTDVMDTILTGIDPTLEETFKRNFKALFTKYNQEILNLIGNTNPELSAQVGGLDIEVLAEEYSTQNLETKRQKYIYPLINAVSNLSKEDLAEMAESLIYLTYLKRRITFAEESVGGPVDVAIISKGDGFIWIKRKHYFKAELNPQFFDNYFNL